METLTGKKLLVLAGNQVHVKVVESAKKLGVHTIVTDYLSPTHSPAKLIADEYWMLSTGDIDAVVEKCLQEKVDGVLSFCIDSVQMHYQQICERLHLPCYGTKEQFQIMTNKRLFKDFCLHNNVDIVPEYVIEDINNNNVSYPVLVKPTDSRGSRGQTVCFSRQDVLRAVAFAEKSSIEGKYIIEKYMNGLYDMGFAYIVINKIPWLLKISDRYLGDSAYNLDRQQIASVLPSRFADVYVSEIESNIVNMIKALNIDFGVVFLQGFFDGKRVYMYDPGMRFPGSDYDIILKQATGFDCMSTFVKFALTGDITSQIGDPLNAYTFNGKTCLIMSVAINRGIISLVKGMDKISQLPEVFSASLWRNIGDVIESTGDVRQRAAEFCCLLPDRASISNFISFVYDTLEILDDNGNNMIISKLDSNKLY